MKQKQIHWEFEHLELLGKWQYFNRLIGLQQLMFEKATEANNDKKRKELAQSISNTIDVYAHVQMEIPKKFDKENLSIMIHCPVFKKYQNPKVTSFRERYVVLESLKALAKQYRKPSLIDELRWWPVNFGEYKNYKAWQSKFQEALGVTSIGKTAQKEIEELIKETVNA